MVAELTAERSSQKPKTDFSGSSLDLIKSFYEWQFRMGTFDFALILRSEGTSLFSALKKSESNVCKTILGIKEAEIALDTLQAASNRGFELVVASNSSIEEMEEFWKQKGYRVVSRSRLGTHKEHDLLTAAWNKEALERMIYIASRMGGKSLCVFSHDADPLYLLTRSAI